jgi:excisionase family DNA binding protein
MRPEQHEINSRTHPDLMTVAEVAEALKTSDSFVYERIKDGSLGHFKLHKAGYRISVEHLEAYLRSRENQSLGPPKLRHLSID